MVFFFFRFLPIVLLQIGFYFNSGFQHNTNIAFTKCEIFENENPVMSPQNIIFEVKHCKSPNVVVYQAKKIANNLLNAENPIDVFWLMNTKGKTIESLTSIEWKLAFGYKIKTIVRGKKYIITLNAIKGREITISLDDTGKVEAFMMINGSYSKLSGVFIDFEYSFCLPDVKYVQFTGHTVDSNKVVVERVTA